MHKVAIVVPVHPPKKKYVRNLIKSFRKNNSQYFDFYMIYTNEEEKECFNKMNENIKSIVLPTDINHSEIQTRLLYPIFKKLYAVYILSQNDQYEYIITIDAESLFLDMKYIHNICKRFTEKKEVYGNICNSCQKYNKVCKSLLKEFDKTFKNIDTSIYFFFSQIPIYECHIAKEFFKFIQFHQFDKIIRKMTWETFEYPLYYYYCVARYGYKIVNLENFGINVKHSLECRLSIAIKTILDENDIDINWQTVNNITLIHAIDYKICILYHLDRGAGPKKKDGCVWTQLTSMVYQKILEKYT